jgi:hypothetical protein
MNTRKMLLATTAIALAVGFENKPGWKMDGDKLALDGDGNPIYVNAAGQEQSVKGDTISTLNAEAKNHRTAKEAAEAQLAKYKGPDGKPIDPEAAIKAIDTVSKIDAKTLIDAGEVDKVRDQIKAEYTAQLTEKDTALTQANTTIDNMKIDGVFKGSQFLADRVAVPRDMVEAALRANFKIEDGKPRAYDRDGNPVMSKKTIGDYADPEEAIELLIDRHPQKDMILKAPDAKGTGNNGGGGGRGGGRTMSRDEFEKLGAVDAAAAGVAMGKGELTITD